MLQGRPDDVAGRSASAAGVAAGSGGEAAAGAAASGWRLDIKAAKQAVIKVNATWKPGTHCYKFCLGSMHLSRQHGVPAVSCFPCSITKW